MTLVRLVRDGVSHVMHIIADGVVCEKLARRLPRFRRGAVDSCEPRWAAGEALELQRSRCDRRFVHALVQQLVEIGLRIIHKRVLRHLPRESICH